MTSVAEDRHTESGSAKANSRMLWIDGVGGYIVAAGDEWLIGGPGAGDSVEIHIQGDLSRRAAAIRRQDGDYVLQPLATTSLNGQTLERPSLLRDGDQFQLGGSVQMIFRKSHPLSASARLDLVSRHRTEPRADGIILLADTCVIGPGRGAHISCPKWESDTILFLGGGVWQIRSDEQLMVDGVDAGQRTEVRAPCRIEGETLAMSMELV